MFEILCPCFHSTAMFRFRNEGSLVCEVEETRWNLLVRFKVLMLIKRDSRDVIRTGFNLFMMKLDTCSKTDLRGSESQQWAGSLQHFDISRRVDGPSCMEGVHSRWYSVRFRYLFIGESRRSTSEEVEMGSVSKDVALAINALYPSDAHHDSACCNRESRFSRTYKSGTFSDTCSIAISSPTSLNLI